MRAKATGRVPRPHYYRSNIHSLKAIGSALLATVAWPLIFLGVNVHIHRVAEAARRPRQ